MNNEYIIIKISYDAKQLKDNGRDYQSIISWLEDVYNFDVELLEKWNQTLKIDEP